MFEGESSAKVSSGSELIELRVHHEFPWNSLVILVLCDRLKVKCRNPSVHGFLWRWAHGPFRPVVDQKKSANCSHCQKGGQIIPDFSRYIIIVVYSVIYPTYIHTYPIISNSIPIFLYNPIKSRTCLFQNLIFPLTNKIYYTTTTSWNLHEFPIQISHVPEMLLLCFAPFFPKPKTLEEVAFATSTASDQRPPHGQFAWDVFGPRAQQIPSCRIWV